MQHNWNLTPEEGSSEGSENPYDNPSFFENTAGCLEASKAWQAPGSGKP